ncbi:uncharacterized protein LOC131463043 isoform X1 [Solea solea]|uniref:uncharacterized protein LOC131463043 isoform X1 n=2 Tax=Solea solea TaxID=90069 RepID=UPI00272C56BA|nr:uncharacterized protein LOC131463043 isoform X1 [Solea solea]XP_058490678.1 uncharacterized protein LOC131463043 isoform X1 [Solea solea]XP_058490679.1 uncharacterized protein LOC131463043 isoform X1 [Solea solea]
MFMYLLYFNQNESESSEEECSGDDCDPEYVPDSEMDTGDDEPPISLASSKLPVAEESQLDTSLELDVGANTHVEESPDKTSNDIQCTTLRKGQNLCFVCKKAHHKIARRFKIHVKENADIAKAVSLPVGSVSRKQLLENLQNRGNFMHNINVLNSGSGSLKVKRKARNEHKKYEYCIHCKGMFVRTELWRHMRRCSSKPEDREVEGRKRVLCVATFIKSVSSGTVGNGLLKMLSRMHDDDIASVIRNDFCLLRFAESLYSKHGHDPSKHDYIRQKICQLGRFLQTMRNNCPALTLEEALKPENFLNVIEAVKETAGFSMDENSYRTLALKIGHSLKCHRG